MQRKILFLDCDGVVNRGSSFDPTNKEYQRSDGYVVERELVARVKQIVADTGCEIVLSSSWRLGSAGREAIQKHVKLVDVTPSHSDYIRGYEVDQWLRMHPDVEQYAILDDNSDFYGEQHLFLTTFKDGLTEEIASKVTNFLNGVSDGRDNRVQDDGALGTGEKGTGAAPPAIGSST
jgi:hypothetical protein